MVLKLGAPVALGGFIMAVLVLTPESIAAFAKALAVAVTGDELPGAQHQIFVRVNTDVDSSGNRQAGSPLFQILAGDMNGS
jgi:hypothetical protein